MTYRKFGTRTKIIAVAIILLAVVLGFFALRSSGPFAKKSPKPSGQTQSTSQTATVATIKADDFTYEKPTNWALLTKERLDSAEAVTGIGRPPGLSATFMVKVSSSTPINDNDLKDSTLSELNKLSNFKLLTVNDTKVDGKTGQKFTYTSGDNDGVKQELSVVVNKQKTFFLLFSIPTSDFDKYTADFTKILSSFKFI